MYKDDYRALLERLKANENEFHELMQRKEEYEAVEYGPTPKPEDVGHPFVIQFVLVTASFFVGWILRGWIQ